MTNAKTTRRALFTSVIALVLCFTMLMGTTFAWFTDSVSSVGNKIMSGTLDVDLIDANNKSLDGEVIEFVDLDDNDLWEPGCTYVTEEFKVVNKGNLALKYHIVVNGINGDAKLLEAIEWSLTITDANGSTVEYEAGTVHTLLPEETSGTIVLSGHMKEEAGNEYQGLTATGISISVFATQVDHESDSFDNTYDKDVTTYVTYDSTKTVAENATALQDALNAAEEGDIIVVGAGNWYATKYKQFVINTDNITLVGVGGTVLGFETENRNSILDVNGDNVTISNIEFNNNKQEFNQCILATGAENLTVDSCTFYGENYQGGNTPTLGIYIFEHLDIADDEKNDEVTKFTITNNTFLGASVGMYKGGANTVATDPGAKTATVSADMVIADNTFDNAMILIENWRSWSKECTRDHELVPTITGNNFVSPNLCFANTPHSIYLRCYRQGDPDKILPATYMTDFVANNTIATPANDTVITYGGQNYVLSDTYGTFYRDNATYGVIAYCYGQNYINA